MLSLLSIFLIWMCYLERIDGNTGTKECDGSECCWPALKVNVEVRVFEDGRDTVSHLNDFVLHSEDLLVKCVVFCVDYILICSEKNV